MKKITKKKNLTMIAWMISCKMDLSGYAILSTDNHEPNMLAVSSLKGRGKELNYKFN